MYKSVVPDMIALAPHWGHVSRMCDSHHAQVTVMFGSTVHYATAAGPALCGK